MTSNLAVQFFVSASILVMAILPIQARAKREKPVNVDTTFTVAIAANILPYKIHITAKQHYAGTWAPTYYTISIMPLAKGSHGQTIHSKALMRFFDVSKDDKLGVSLVDANFDGYRDIKIFDWASENLQNYNYKFFLFNPRTKRFQFAQDFSDRFGWNTMVDTAAHELSIGGAEGKLSVCWHNEVYKRINGAMTLVKRDRVSVLDSVITESGEFTFVYTLELLRGGQLTLEKRFAGSIEKVNEMADQETLTR